MEAPRTNTEVAYWSMISAGRAGTVTRAASPPASELRINELQCLLWQLAVMLPDLPLHDTDRAEARAELRTAQAQLGSPRPKLSILRESLRTIRGILAGIPGGDGYGSLVQTLEQLAP